MLHIHFANHLESLGGLLVDRIGAAAGSAFDVDEVIVPSAAMQRHLTLALARQHGICANVRFSYLARWLWQQIGRVVPDVQAESPFDPSVLAWRIYAAFGDAAWLRAHARLAAYLERADAAMRFELAMRVAALFDQYLTYRPEWLAAWLRGEPAALGKVDTKALDDHDWQAALWRRLARETRTDDRHPVTSCKRWPPRAVTLRGAPCPGLSTSSPCPPCRPCTWACCTPWLGAPRCTSTR
jgi:exodeoxyribonuclease V gamma subunit